MGEAALERGGYAVIPFGFEASLGTAHHLAGKPEKTAAMVRNTIARNSGAVTALSQALLAWVLINSGVTDEAMAVVEGLPAAVDMSDNPQVKVLALTSYSWAYMHVDPLKAYNASRHALSIARDSGNRYVETTTLLGLSRMAVSHDDPIEAIDLLIDRTGSYHDSGSVLLVPGPLALIAVLLGRFGRYEPAAIIMGVGDRPGPRTTFREIDSAIVHLREVLGDQTYESFAREGAAMTTAAAVTYALEQIKQLRETVVEQTQKPPKSL
jgi:hypothetical protein